MYLNSAGGKSNIIENIELFQKSIQSYEYNGDSIYVSCSIGITLSSETGISYREMFRNADNLLYTVKKSNKGSYKLSILR